MIHSETQYKVKNTLYTGFSFAYFFLITVVFTGTYAFVQGEFLAEQIHNNGHLPYVMLFSIFPLLFLIAKLSSKITTKISGDRLILNNSFLFIPYKFKSFNIKDFSTVGIMTIKNTEVPVTFGVRPKTPSKVFYISGKKAIKLKPFNKSVNNTIIIGTQLSDEWVETFKSKNLIVEEEKE